MEPSERRDVPPLLLATVCFLQRRGRVLLQERAPDRRWAGRLNGPGGKVDRGESPTAAIMREVAEETGLHLVDPVGHSQLELIFGEPAGERMRVFIYTAEQWTGRVRGGREGRLRWWAVDRLPFDRLWPDMRFWLPLVLAGGTVHGVCTFDVADDTLRSCTLQLAWGA
jgi:mutator protein MutT